MSKHKRRAAVGVISLVVAYLGCCALLRWINGDSVIQESELVMLQGKWDKAPTLLNYLGGKGIDTLDPMKPGGKYQLHSSYYVDYHSNVVSGYGAGVMSDPLGRYPDRAPYIQLRVVYEPRFILLPLAYFARPSRDEIDAVLDREREIVEKRFT
jgi:hypothetical protein